MEINETKVRLEFHIYAILDFDLLIGYPSEVLFQVKLSHGSLNKELGETAVATPIPYPKKSNGEAASQPWPVRGGEVHFPIHFTFL